MTAEERLRMEQLRRQKLRLATARNVANTTAWNMARVLVPWHRDETGCQARVVGNP